MLCLPPEPTPASAGTRGPAKCGDAPSDEGVTHIEAREATEVPIDAPEPLGRWWIEDPWVGHDGEELVQARPRNGPGSATLRQLLHPLSGGLVPGRLRTVRVGTPRSASRSSTSEKP
jgi:hypothetical protein